MLPSASKPSKPCISTKSAKRADDRADELRDDVQPDLAPGIRPPIAAPTETAGLKCAPETRPNA